MSISRRRYLVSRLLPPHTDHHLIVSVSRLSQDSVIFEYCHGSVHDLTRSFRNQIILDVVDVDMPPYERDSTGLWIDLSSEALKLMNEKEIQVAAALHSAEHAFLNRFAMAADLRTECKNAAKEFKTRDSSRKRPAR